MAQVQVHSVRWLGSFMDGEVLLGQDARGQSRLALERRLAGTGTFTAWGTRLSGPATSVQLLKLRTYGPLDLLVQVGGDAPAVTGLDAHTGEERWREAGTFVKQGDMRILIQNGNQVIQRSIFTRERQVRRWVAR